VRVKLSREKQIFWSSIDRTCKFAQTEAEIEALVLSKDLLSRCTRTVFSKPKPHISLGPINYVGIVWP